MKITIEIEDGKIINATPEVEKLTTEQITKQLKIFKDGINRELYINDPLYHHMVVAQMNALACGRPDWFMFGSVI